MNIKSEFAANKNIFLGIIILFGLLICFTLRDYIPAFLGALLFYVLFKEKMRILVVKKKWKKSTAALFLMSISFVIILIPLSLFVMMVYTKLVPIASNPNLVMKYVHRIDYNIYHQFGMKILSVKNTEALQSKITDLASNILNQGLSVFTSIVMLYFFLYFLFINFNRMEAFSILSLPFKKENIKIFGTELKAQTFSNAIGIPLIAVSQGLFGFIIYLLTGVPDAWFWGILTGFASIIPVIGTGIIWIPVCGYLFYMGDSLEAVIVIAWSVLIMGSMDNVIRFLLAKKMADVHPVVTVLGIIIGLEYLGLTGLIFGPLIISYFIILLKIYYFDYQVINKKEIIKEPVLEIDVPFIYNRKFTSEDFKKK